MDLFKIIIIIYKRMYINSNVNQFLEEGLELVNNWQHIINNVLPIFCFLFYLREGKVKMVQIDLHHLGAPAGTDTLGAYLLKRSQVMPRQLCSRVFGLIKI